jgi:phosphatidate phosphatase PAH1
MKNKKERKISIQSYIQKRQEEFLNESKKERIKNEKGKGVNFCYDCLTELTLENGKYKLGHRNDGLKRICNTCFKSNGAYR